jgi:hypothetical protein
MLAKKHLTQEGLDRVRKIRSTLNKSRAFVDSGSTQIEENLGTSTKRVLMKAISVREVASGKIRCFSSIREAYFYLSPVTKVSISTISRNIDTGKPVKGYTLSRLNSTD